MAGVWTTARRALAGIAVLVVAVSGCGDDDEGAADEGGDVTTYCAAVAAIEATDTAPTVEQMETIRAAAPEEIRDDVDVVADAFIEGIESGDFESVFEDEDVTRRLEEVIEPFEDENCPNNEDGDDEG